MKKHSAMGLIALLAPLVVSFAFGQDIFVPEVPQLIDILHTNQAMVQLTLSLFMLAVGAGQLIVGPLSDQFGRKKIVLISTALYCLSSVMAAAVPTINLLIVARILQGLGACGMMVSAFAIVRDCFAGDECAKIYSYLNCAISISPLFAPMIGSYLDLWFGWRAPFVALAIISLLVFIANLILLTETQDPKNKIKISMTLFKRYWQILRNRDFATYSFAATSALACFFTFFSISSYIIIKILQIPETQFGYYFATVGLIFFFASLLSGHLCTKIGTVKVVLIGSIGFLISGIWMTLWTLKSGTTIANFMLPSCLTAITGAFLLGGGAGGALAPFGEMAGTAAALLGAMEFLGATIVGSFIMQWPVKSNLPYAIPLMVFGLLATIGCCLNHWLKPSST